MITCVLGPPNKLISLKKKKKTKVLVSDGRVNPNKVMVVRRLRVEAARLEGL